MPDAASPPVVAVLVSTFNGETFLEAQLDSLRGQVGVAVRLHARDDGSTDGTVALLRRHAERWPQLAGLTAGANLRPARSFLELLRTAPAADYYAFCDQDDVWRPSKLARAVEALAAEAEPALYCSNVTCVAEDLRVLGVPLENGDARFQHLLFENIAYGCTTVMNRAARELIASRTPEHGVVMHDWWCALVVAAFGRVLYDPEPRMILYRQHGGNTVGSDVSTLATTWRLVRSFLRRPRSTYRIHGQASELLRLFGEEIPVGPRMLVERLVRSKRSFTARMRYALSNAILRRQPLDALAARALVAAGWY